jgi:hypothetical protein
VANGKLSSGLLADFEALPDAMKRYLIRHTSELRAFCEALPLFLIQATTMPDTPEGYAAWASQLQAAIVAQAKIAEQEIQLLPGREVGRRGR